MAVGLAAALIVFAILKIEIGKAGLIVLLAVAVYAAIIAAWIFEGRKKPPRSN